MNLTLNRYAVTPFIRDVCHRDMYSTDKHKKDREI